MSPPRHTDPEWDEKRRVRQANKHDRAREDILAAAHTILLEKGIGGTTLAAVAREAGLSKPALYYYFPSKDVLLFELIYRTVSAHGQRVHDAVDTTTEGAAAIRALIETFADGYRDKMDDFRLVYMQSQLAAPGNVKVDAGQLERIRPLNDLWLAGAEKRIAEGGPTRAGISPRMIAFLAQISVVGLLTFKGMVEALDDPLLYSDDELISALSAVFAAAIGPAET